MIVDHSAAGLSIREADDFRAFKSRVRAAGPTRPYIASIIFVDDGDVLVDIATVKRLAGTHATEAWNRDFGRMVDYAATKD